MKLELNFKIVGCLNILAQIEYVTLYFGDTKPYFIIQVMRSAKYSISFCKEIFYLLLKNYFGRVIGISLFFVYESNIYSHNVYPTAEFISINDCFY